MDQDEKSLGWEEEVVVGIDCLPTHVPGVRKLGLSHQYPSMFLTYHCLWASRFLFSMERTSEVNLRKKTLPWWCQEVRIITHTNNSRGFIFISLHLSASRTGKRLSRAVSLGSLNQDLMGIALSAEAELERRALARHVHQSGLPGYALYAPGELSKMKTEERSAQMADRSLV